MVVPANFLISRLRPKNSFLCAEVVPIIFHRPLTDPHQLHFAIGEALAHLNYMLRIGALTAEPDATGALRYKAV